MMKQPLAYLESAQKQMPGCKGLRSERIRDWLEIKWRSLMVKMSRE